MAIELPPLPYAEDALDPHISARTISFHYGKHHATYVANLNGLIEGTPNENKSLEQIIADAEPGGLFNNAAQVWNHTFYWNSMTPSGGGDPSGDLAAAIDASFGSASALKEELVTRARGISGPAGHGSSRTATAWPSSTPTMPTPRSSTARRRCSPSTCGNTPTTSITRTPARPTSRRSSTSS